MAKRKRAVKGKAARRGAAAKKGAQREPTISLAQFAGQVRTRLSRLEREIQSASATKQLTRMLRDASHQLGKWEAAGEKRWRKLTAQARADALKLLKRIEKALSPAPPKARPPRPMPAATVAPRPVAPRPPAPSPIAPPTPTYRPPMPTPSGMPPSRGEGEGS